MSEDQNSVTALEERVAALEASLAEHRRALEAILNSTPLRMAGLRSGEMFSAVVTLHTIAAAKPREAANKVHPADAAIKAGAKLKGLSGELQR
jgi:hypothetical protein